MLNLSKSRNFRLGLVPAACFFTVAAGIAAEPIQQAALSTEMERSWINRLFAAPAADARQIALQQIEAMGLPYDANSCLRAVAAKNRNLIDLFVKSGFDLNSRGARGRTAMMEAALQGDWALASDLMKAGASPNCPDENGSTPLMIAAMGGQTEALKAFLKGGADLNAKDGNGHSAIHYAVAAKRGDAVRDLIAAGAAVTGACCDEHDVLTHAFEAGDKAIIVAVLEAEPSDLKWSRESRAYLTQAIASRDAALTHLLLSKHAAPPTPEGKAQPLLGYAILENDLPKFKFLLDCGADPNSLLNSPVEKSFSAQVPSAFTKLYLEEEGGMTTLMLAAGLNKTDFVRALLEKGAKRNLLTTKYKMPAVLFAARTEVVEIMQMLMGDCPTPEQMRIEISLAAQRLDLYKDGQSIFSAPVSTGRVGFATPAGKYVITDKHRTHRSTIYKTAEMPFFMRLNFRDFGMHEGQLPGYPASHGCIRLPSEVAQKLYRDVPIGTLVSIN